MCWRCSYDPAIREQHTPGPPPSDLIPIGDAVVRVGVGENRFRKLVKDHGLAFVWWPIEHGRVKLFRAADVDKLAADLREKAPPPRPVVEPDPDPDEVVLYGLLSRADARELARRRARRGVPLTGAA